MYRASIYVVAHDATHENVDHQERLRHWKLDRFEKATALDEWFKPDADVDLQRHLGQGVGIFSGEKTKQFVIQVSPHAARWIREEPWHPQQSLQLQEDGSYLLTVSAYQSTEIIAKVLELGKEAELLSPTECRDEIRSILTKLLEKYLPS